MRTLLTEAGLKGCSMPKLNLLTRLMLHPTMETCGRSYTYSLAITLRRINTVIPQAHISTLLFIFVNGTAAFPSGAVCLAHCTHRQHYLAGQYSIVTFLCFTVSCLCKGKLKLSHYTPRRCLGERRYSSYSFSTSALDGGEWSASHRSRSSAPAKGPLVPIVQEAWWAPEPVWTQRVEEKSLCLCLGLNLDRPVVQPVTRHYTDWATRLTSCLHLQYFMSHVVLWATSK
jgi:hypothetical protein